MNDSGGRKLHPDVFIARRRARLEKILRPRRAP
jgi:hypothetical protein